MVILCRFEGLYGRICVVCRRLLIFPDATRCRCNPSNKKTNRKRPLCPHFWSDFFLFSFILKGHNLHYFLVCSSRSGARRAGINNNRIPKTCPELGSRSGQGSQNAAGIQSSRAGELLRQHSRFSELFCKLSLAKLRIRTALGVVRGAVTAGWQTLCLRGWSDCCLCCGRNIFPCYSLIILVAQSPAVLLLIFSFIIETPNTLWSISACV